MAGPAGYSTQIQVGPRKALVLVYHVVRLGAGTAFVLLHEVVEDKMQRAHVLVILTHPVVICPPVLLFLMSYCWTNPET